MAWQIKGTQAHMGLSKKRGKQANIVHVSPMTHGRELPTTLNWSSLLKASQLEKHTRNLEIL